MCKFSTDFAEKYAEARSTLAKTLVAGRAGEARMVSPGIFRRRIHGGNWQNLNVDDQIKRHFGDDNIKIQVEANGKLLIHPDPMTSGRPIILYDVSGDYFRIMDGKVNTQGKIVTTRKFYKADGSALGPPPNGVTSDDWLNQNVETTHFTASP